MSGTTIDHMVSVMIFLAAMLIFISLFNQTIQTAVVYQQHSALATKTSDLLDNMLLSAGIPTYWGQNDTTSVTGFGLQAPDFMQYQLSPFSLMHLSSSAGTSVYYPGTGLTYSNITMSFGQSLLVPSNEALNYSQTSAMLGINGSYGFSLTVSPTVNVAVSEVQHSPLKMSINVTGPGFPLANATINYCFITVTGNGSQTSYPVYTLYPNATSTDPTGAANVDLSGFDVAQKSYALIAYASLSGLSGVGYYENPLYTATGVVPFVSSFSNGTIILADSYGVNGQGYSGDLAYNATFLRASDMIKIDLTNGTGTKPLNGLFGKLNEQQIPKHDYDTLTIDPNTLGILVISYSISAQQSGIAVMPWGFSSLGFSITFGGNSANQNWVSTDVRQVLVNNVSYQAKLDLWSNQGYQVTG